MEVLEPELDLSKMCYEISIVLLNNVVALRQIGVPDNITIEPSESCARSRLRVFAEFKLGGRLRFARSKSNRANPGKREISRLIRRLSGADEMIK